MNFLFMVVAISSHCWFLDRGCGRYECFRSVAVDLDIELEKLVVGCCVGMVSVMAAAC